MFERASYGKAISPLETEKNVFCCLQIDEKLKVLYSQIMCNQTNISTVTTSNIFKTEFSDAINNFISYF